MGQYSAYISPKRRSVPTPERLVDNDGRCVFGTFESEFESMDFTAAKRPTAAPTALNRLRLSLWQATEVHIGDAVLLAAVSDMGIFGIVLNVFYDKRTKTARKWSTNLRSSDTHIAPNLLRGSVTEAHTDEGFIRYVNNFECGSCRLEGRHRDADGFSISYELSLSRISSPSIVSIPFGKNRPLYSQKDFLTADGNITVNGERFDSDADSVAIVDDHRGYYPRRAHYDWVTTLGKCEIDGERKFLAFNLTRNQSIDQNDYNENLIWFEKGISLLPPVKFTRDPESAVSGGKSVWTIRDDYGMVDLTFSVRDMASMVTHAKVINLDYYIAFGELNGSILDEDGKKYILDGMLGIGEDKTLLL